MSRSGLYRLTCEIRSKVTTTDSYGQYITTYQTQSTPRCGMKELNGQEIVALGLPVHTKVIRVYLNHDIDVIASDQIIIDDRIYEVVYINVLGLRTGLCKGLQVDCKFIGFCESIDIYSSSSSSSSSSEEYSTSSSSSSDFCCSEFEIVDSYLNGVFTNITLNGVNGDNAPDCELRFTTVNYGNQQVILYSGALTVASGQYDGSPTFVIAENNESGISGTMDWDGTFIVSADSTLVCK